MDGKTGTGALIDEDSPSSTRIGRVRWTICAMLFAATTSTTWIGRSSASSSPPSSQHRHDRGELRLHR